MKQAVNVPFDTILSTRELAIGYLRGKKVVRTIYEGLNMNIFRGEMICLIGPNGVGKSTLIRTLSGMQPPVKGVTYIDDKPLNSRHFKDLSRLISVVLTDKINPGHLTVSEMVAMGRHPHTNWFGQLEPDDVLAIETYL